MESKRQWFPSETQYNERGEPMCGAHEGTRLIYSHTFTTPDGVRLEAWYCGASHHIVLLASKDQNGEAA